MSLTRWCCCGTYGLKVSPTEIRGGVPASVTLESKGFRADEHRGTAANAELGHHAGTTFQVKVSTSRDRLAGWLS